MFFLFHVFDFFRNFIFENRCQRFIGDFQIRGFFTISKLFHDELRSFTPLKPPKIVSDRFSEISSWPLKKSHRFFLCFFYSKFHFQKNWGKNCESTAKKLRKKRLSVLGQFSKSEYLTLPDKKDRIYRLLETACRAEGRRRHLPGLQPNSIYKPQSHPNPPSSLI